MTICLYFKYSTYLFCTNILQYRQKEVIRLCMKHFRKLEQSEIVETLQRVTGVPLEDPTLTRLYDLLVIKGDHLQAECFISNAVMSEYFSPLFIVLYYSDTILESNMIYNTVGLLNDYINAQTYRAVWTKLSFNDGKPGMRGGHQMVLDPIAELLYLFGGWDGNQDLSDLWVYNIASNRWTIICKDTEAVVSCQKKIYIILDREFKC